MSEDNGTGGADNPGDGGADAPKSFTMDEFKNTQWRESISDESIRTHGGMANFKSIDDLAKSLVARTKK